MTIIALRPPRIALVLLLIAAAVHWGLSCKELGMRFPLPWTGVILGTIGFSIMVRSWLLFKNENLAVCPLEKTVRLTVRGPYRFSRNPMYLGMVLMMAGTALIIGTFPFYVAACVYFIVLNNFFCPYEERKLMKAFGAEYEQYRGRVRRWL